MYCVILSSNIAGKVHICLLYTGKINFCFSLIRQSLNFSQISNMLLNWIDHLNWNDIINDILQGNYNISTYGIRIASGSQLTFNATPVQDFQFIFFCKIVFVLSCFAYNYYFYKDLKKQTINKLINPITAYFIANF